MLAPLPPRRFWATSLLALGALAACQDSTAPPPAPAGIVAIAGNAQTGTVGELVATQPAVVVSDSRGKPMRGVSVTFLVSVGGGRATDSVQTTDAEGRASVGNWRLGTVAGQNRLTATAGKVSTVFTATGRASVPAALVKVAGDSQSVLAGDPVESAPAVVVQDEYGNPVAGARVTFQVTSGGGSISGGAINADVTGRAAVGGWTLGPISGPNTVTATAASATTVFTANGLPTGRGITGTITIDGDPGAALADALGVTATRSRAGALGAPRGDGSGEAYALPVRPLIAAARQPPRQIQDELIVSFRSAPLRLPARGSAALRSANGARQAAATIRDRLASRGRQDGYAVKGASGVLLSARVKVEDPRKLTAVAAELLRDPAVERVERNAVAYSHRSPARASIASATYTPGSNDYFYGRQSWHYAMVDAPRAWAITSGSRNVLVAVVDDGIRFDHPDIRSNLTDDGYDFVTNYSLDQCGGGKIGSAGDGGGYDPDPTIPASHSTDPDNNNCVLPVTDEVGAHGLHVAGTIGAVGNNGTGVTGVNWTVRIRPVRVLGITGFGTYYDIAQGILYSAGLPADDGAGGQVQASSRAAVINLSLGGGSPSDVLESAVTRATAEGSLVIASAGNSGSSSLAYPAAYPQVMSVSAVGPAGSLAGYSSYGSTIDIAAPGGDIAAGSRGDFGVLSTIWRFSNGTPLYMYGNGTSMAAPHVSGVAALVLAREPGLTVTQLRDRLLGYAVDVGAPGRDDSYGAGIVNARNSLTRTLAPPRRMYAHLVNAAGALIRTADVNTDGSYALPDLRDGTYRLYAGEDENGDGNTGVPGRRWGAFGGTTTPATITVSEAGTQTASFAVGFPAEREPNDDVAGANDLPIGGYFVGSRAVGEVDYYRVQVPSMGEYTFETFGAGGACGFALEENTSLRLLSSTGTQLAENNDIDQQREQFCSRITIQLNAGTYYLAVEGFSGGRYRLQARAGR